jgi:hypothetical protein
MPATSSYKFPISPATTPGRSVTVSRKPNIAAKEDADKESVPDETREFYFLPLQVPMPDGVDSGTVVVDVGDQLILNVSLHSPNDECARKSAKMLRAFAGLIRGELLSQISMLDMAESFPKDLARDLSGLPVKLIRPAEKAWQEARVHIDGKMVTLSVTTAVDTKTLSSELDALRDVTASADPISMCYSPLPFFWYFAENISLPSRHSREQAVPYDPLSNGQAIPPAPAYPVGPQYMPPPPNARNAIPQLAPPAPEPMPTPVAVPPPASLPVKLTVANVRKEAALLFTVGDNGKLTFAQKIPPGEAVDLQTTSGQRWIAVFTDNPAGETFQPTQATETWLLRAEKNTSATR